MEPVNVVVVAVECGSARTFLECVRCASCFHDLNFHHTTKFTSSDGDHQGVVNMRSFSHAIPSESFGMIHLCGYKSRRCITLQTNRSTILHTYTASRRSKVQTTINIRCNILCSSPIFNKARAHLGLRCSLLVCIASALDQLR